MELVKKLLPYIILLGIVSYVLVSSFGLDNNLLTLTEYNGIKLYTFDLRKYVSRIQYIWSTYYPTWKNLNFRTDIQTWPNSLLILDYFKVFVHNFFIVLGWFMLPISVLTYVGNFVLFAVQMLFALIGMPYNATIMYVLEALQQLANIPNILVDAIASL